MHHAIWMELRGWGSRCQTVRVRQSEQLALQNNIYDVYCQLHFLFKGQAKRVPSCSSWVSGARRRVKRR